jgi:hypothetical protein
MGILDLVPPRRVVTRSPLASFNSTPSCSRRRRYRTPQYPVLHVKYNVPFTFTFLEMSSIIFVACCLVFEVVAFREESMSQESPLKLSAYAALMQNLPARRPPSTNHLERFQVDIASRCRKVVLSSFLFSLALLFSHHGWAEAFAFPDVP